VKDAVRKLVERLRNRGVPSQPPSESHPSSGHSFPFVDASGKSGLTVYDDRALRLRSLTVSGTPAEFEDPGAIPGTFKIRVAKREGFRRAAGTLVERRYSGRGYDAPAQKQDPQLFTFVAYDEGNLVGTVGIRLDSDQGLSADDLYQDETAALREGGCKICEFTRLAVDYQTVSKLVLAGLFHTAYMFAYEIRGHDYAVIEVNPRHALFYRRALLFEQIGEERLNRRVNAPAVLMCLPFERVPPELERFGGRPELSKTTHLMYPYFFGAEGAAGILHRLRELDRSRA
jgi:hypothetical protein